MHGALGKGKTHEAHVGTVCEVHMGTRCMVHQVKVRHMRHVWVCIRNPGLSSLSHSSHLQLHTTNVYIKWMQE
jgi:hypothetical protein